MGKDGPAFIALQAEMKDRETKIASLESRLLDEEERSENFRTENATLKSERDGLAADLAATKTALQTKMSLIRELETKADKHEAKIAELTEGVKQRDDAALRTDVLTLVRAATDRGIAPSFFEGHDRDPVAWFKGRFASVEAFKDFIAALPADEKRKHVHASDTNPRGDGADISLSQESTRALKRLGLNPKYANVVSESDLPEKG